MRPISLVEILQWKDLNGPAWSGTNTWSNRLYLESPSHMLVRQLLEGMHREPASHQCWGGEDAAEDCSSCHPFYKIRIVKMVPSVHELPSVAAVLEAFLTSQLRISHSFSSKCIVFLPYYTMLYMRIKWANTFKGLRRGRDLRSVSVQVVLAPIIIITSVKFSGMCTHLLH